MTDLIPYQGKKPIVMKSGLVHWVSDPTAERLQQQLQTQKAHTFVRLQELSITINTAEVEGVYTMEEYENISKVKQGMWQCEYNVWHNKGKRECECRSEFYKRSAQARRAREKADDNRPLTAEDRERNAGRMKHIGDAMRASGVLVNNLKADPKKENGKTCLNPACGKPLTGYLGKYCSGECMNAVESEIASEGMPSFID